MLMIQFNLDGPVKPKGRPRFSKVGGFVRTYTDKKTLDYESLVREAAIQALGSSETLETPIAVYLLFRLPIPQSYSKKRTEACLDGSEMPGKKPDIDNLAKSVLDGMNGVIYKDDAQIVNLHAVKVYSTVPGVNVTVREVLP